MRPTWAGMRPVSRWSERLSAGYQRLDRVHERASKRGRRSASDRALAPTRGIVLDPGILVLRQGCARIEYRERIPGTENLGIQHQIGPRRGKSGLKENALDTGVDCFVTDDPTGWLDALIEPDLAPIAIEIFPEGAPADVSNGDRKSAIGPAVSW